MRVPRIHIEAQLLPGRPVTVPEGPARHLARVLRLGIGDEVVAFDGSGAEYRCVLSVIDRGFVQIQVRERRELSRESPLRITLVQGISAGDRMDYTVQKAVELGVARIVPVEMERSVVHLRGERAERRVEHWRQVAASACEQCGRNVLPEIAPIERYDRWCATMRDDLSPSIRVLLSPGGETTLDALSRSGQEVVLLVGPEGGLTDAEQALATRVGFRGVRFGPRILRTETAALAALAVLQVLWGDFSGPT